MLRIFLRMKNIWKKSLKKFFCRYFSSDVFKETWRADQQVYSDFLFDPQGNKGGVSIRFSFYGHTLCFLNCHLTPHIKYATHRVGEFESIVETQMFDCNKASKIVDHRWGKQSKMQQMLKVGPSPDPLKWDELTFSSSTLSRLVFWFGDLNFRIQDHGMHFIRSCLTNKTYNLLWSNDQVWLLTLKVLQYKPGEQFMPR